MGVGICGGWDDTCLSCLRGDFVNCANGVLTGIMIDGGYAEVMIIEARTTVTIPDGLESVKAAPLLCAGVTTYNALRNAGLRAGALVAIQGVGGLGHLGIQYARRMGFRTMPLVSVRNRGSSQKNSARTNTSTAERKMRERGCEHLAEPMPSLPPLQVAKQCPVS